MNRQRLVEAASAGTSGGGPMEPGDVRVIVAKDKATGEVVKTLTIHRTARPYVYDLCDAYNAAAPDGLIYYVDHANQLAMTTKDRAPIRNSNWKPAPGEVEAIQAKIAKLVAQGMTQDEFNRLVDQGRI